MSNLRQTNLVLFFTRGTSLQIWNDIGMLSREVAIYRSLRTHLRNISFVTYGTAGDLRFADQLEDIHIICNRWKLSEQWYLRLLTRFYPMLWLGATIVKSNQIRGAEIALRASRCYGKKFVARCGYLYSDFVERKSGLNSREAKKAQVLEQNVFSNADRVVVTTTAMRQALLERYSLLEERIRVIPNYVQTDLFYPQQDSRSSNGKICFVGRLDEQKNIFALLKAIKGLEVELIIVGSGKLEERLRAEVKVNKLPVRFLGNIHHQQLPEILNSAELFVLPSHYEGHPKVLLEAMSCGLPVIGTDVPGIRELIHHCDTGFLCNTSPEEIQEAIRIVLSDRYLCARMSRNARNYVVQHFSLERISKMELAFLKELAEE